MDVEVQTRSTLRERLSRETRAFHNEIEAVMELDRPNFTSEDYFKYLIRFRHFYREFEAFVEASETSAAAFYSGGREKLGLLNLDLLGSDFETNAAASVDFANILPTEEHLWGAIYVVEGSTLGGQFLTRKFEKKFGAEILNRTHFFNSYGDQVGKCWQATVSAINHMRLDSNQNDNVIEGAKRTFVAMGEYFKNIR